MTQLTIALLQNKAVSLDPLAQMEALRQAAGDAAAAGVQLLITPELFMSGYYIPGNFSEVAEASDGPAMQAVAAIARNTGLAVLIGYPEKSQDGVYNSAALVGGDGELLVNHRKMHLPGAYEKSHFIISTNTVQVAQVAGVRVAPMICYDVEFPEAVRAAALAGAELVAVPTALVDQYAFLTRTLIPTRAFENGLFVAYANHAGPNEGLAYCGLSTLARPDGTFIQTSGSDEDLLITSIDTAQIADARERIPYLSDRRNDLWG